MTWYLGKSEAFTSLSAEAAMYFDDLMVIAHRDHMYGAAKFVEKPSETERFSDRKKNLRKRI